MSAMTAVAKESVRVSWPADTSKNNGSLIMNKKSSTAQRDDRSYCGRNLSTQDVKRQSVLWHRRLGHAVPVEDVACQVKDSILPMATCTNLDCESCAKSKFRRQFKGSLTSLIELA